MANLRDVRMRMKSIGQTLQVTKAMNLISTSKLRKGRRLLQNTEPYFNRIQKTMSDILHNSGKVNSEYFKKEKKTVHTAIVVITSDRGLAGGYNANVFKHTLELCKTVEKPILVLIGNVGQRYFVNSPYMVLENFTFGGYVPTVDDAQILSEYIISQFDWGVFSEVHIVYTHMFSTIKLLPQDRQVLPLDEEKIRLKIQDTTPFSSESKDEDNKHFEYIPSAVEVFDHLAPLYIRGILYGCLVEAYASEQSARMSAMDEASRNGEDMLAAQQLYYNRVRQSGITQEVTEIVSGSSALLG
ncbi:MAG: ATP synthase F1 subunit gamma [Termitinemataceae bacterium]|nr:MAG: ATP synthase F1 subunit gamma [Termitinemataceae bacterium]